MRLPTVKALLVCIAAAMSMGCAENRIFYAATEYPTREAALQAAQGDLDSLLRDIRPTFHPIEARALMVLPTERTVRRIIHKQGVESGYSPSGEDLDYRSRLYEMDLQIFAEGLRRRQVFQELAVERDDNPESVDQPGYDFTIYHEAKGTGSMQFFLKPASSDMPELIGYDARARIGPGLLSWFDNLEAATHGYLPGSAKGEAK